ncbi:LysR family transcriptional regulator [Paenibacillus sp. IB182496]|uniref:LysR family transcriptional regulator n=2 Tax=Paenibacillus sabuli TaxID=2772509 RepID=A0A927BQ86_9BACL|nr:LysR family transcriptional regulator [Paenibacillus sabuli]
MNIENIEAFVFVVHFGSFNKAAEALYLSQPSVTARIQSLERELDAKLFDRAGKQVRISEAGERFLPYARQILVTYESSKRHVNPKTPSPDELRIGCTLSVANYIVPDLLPHLTARFPNTRFRIVTATSDDIAARVADNEVDLGFTRSLTHPQLQSVKFYEDLIQLHVYPDHPLLNCLEPPSVGRIAQEKLIFFECGALDWLRIHRLFEGLKQPPDICFHTDNSEMAKKLVMRRAGIAFLPALSARQEVKDGLLLAVPVPEAAGISLQTNLIYTHGVHAELVEAILAFGKVLHEKFDCHIDFLY